MIDIKVLNYSEVMDPKTGLFSAVIASVVGLQFVWAPCRFRISSFQSEHRFYALNQEAAHRNTAKSYRLLFTLKYKKGLKQVCVLP